MRKLILLLTLTIPASAQWQLQDGHTTASLRGIHAIGNGIAWASGTEGTVLRTTDQGKTWQPCTIPPGAEKLDFRGIQAFDANTAIVMSSGKGDLSRLYKTTDACKTWKLLFTNPDPEGFFDAFTLDGGTTAKASSGGLLVGDPVKGRFPMWRIPRGDSSITVKQRSGIPAVSEEAAFAASNSAIFHCIDGLWLGTGGPGGARVMRARIHGLYDLFTWTNYPAVRVPIANRNSSSGIFSLAFEFTTDPSPHDWERQCSNLGVAVGGDYQRPDEQQAIAAFTQDGGVHWTQSQSQPHGYRSSAGYYEIGKIWITVGPNGTDISKDDGRNWQALHPTPQGAPDEDKSWNAISLPFVVGPKGRIGILRPEALATH